MQLEKFDESPQQPWALTFTTFFNHSNADNEEIRPVVDLANRDICIIVNTQVFFFSAYPHNTQSHKSNHSLQKKKRGSLSFARLSSIQHNWVQMVREIKASLVSHASLIQAMTPNLAAGAQQLWDARFTFLLSISKSQHDGHTSHSLSCYCGKVSYRYVNNVHVWIHHVLIFFLCLHFFLFSHLIKDSAPSFKR